MLQRCSSTALSLSSPPWSACALGRKSKGSRVGREHKRSRVISELLGPQSGTTAMLCSDGLCCASLERLPTQNQWPKCQARCLWYSTGPPVLLQLALKLLHAALQAGKRKQAASNCLVPSSTQQYRTGRRKCTQQPRNRHCGFQLLQLHTAMPAKGTAAALTSGWRVSATPTACQRTGTLEPQHNNSVLTSSWRASATSTSSRIDLACSASSAARASSAACRCKHHQWMDRGVPVMKRAEKSAAGAERVQRQATGNLLGHSKPQRAASGHSQTSLPPTFSASAAAACAVSSWRRIMATSCATASRADAASRRAASSSAAFRSSSAALLSSSAAAPLSCGCATEDGCGCAAAWGGAATAAGGGTAAAGSAGEGSMPLAAR